MLVILDGDGAVFQDYLYSSGREGGAEAASLLQQAIKQQLKELYPDANLGDYQIVVNVVLNVQGLGKKLQSCNIISGPAELQSFGRAFGLAQPLFNFIDVGDGKERADHKIRETLRLFLPIPQCKHVFFGPCVDNGYLPFLEPFKRDSLIAPRITLVETRPSEPGFIDLGFRRTRFPSIFRDTNLPNRPMAAPPVASPSALPIRTASNMQVTASTFVPQSTAGAHKPQKSTSPAPSADSTSSSTWATIGKSTTGGKNINIASKKQVARPSIVLNVDDDRLDPPLPRTDPGAEKRFATRLKEQGKCCNDHHLLGKCAAGEYCDYVHGEKLSPGEMLVLKHKARSRSCPQKHTCRAFDCTYGHHCKYGKGCLMDNCWFADSHYVDLVSLAHILPNHALC